MPRKKYSNNKINGTVLGVLIIVVLIIIIPSSSRNDVLDYTVVPVKQVIYSITTGITKKISNTVHSTSIAAQNKKLILENQKLKLKLTLQNNYLLNHLSLKKEKKFVDNIPYNVEIAKVTYINPQNLYKEIVINKGGKSGIKIGMVVVSGNHLIGIIKKVASKSSVVKMLTSKKVNISVTGIHGQSLGITNGTDKNIIDMKFKFSISKFKVGDLLYTTGIGGMYPRGLYIGSITKIIHYRNSIYSEIAKVNSQIAILKLSYVIIIKGKK